MSVDPKQFRRKRYKWTQQLMSLTGKEGVGCDSTDDIRAPTDGMKFKGTEPSLSRGTG